MPNRHCPCEWTAEWLVWTRLVATSGGDLHVFLPLDGRGVDGIVHRISTDGFARVQVKGRSLHRYRGIEIQVRADELVDDQAVVVAVEVDLPTVQLGEYALVADVPAFRRLAHRHVGKERDAYDAEVALPPPDRQPVGAVVRARGRDRRPPASTVGGARGGATS
jgi:hypothetical protein